jgi:hypothetical protein
MTVLDAPRVDTIILDETILNDTACCKFDRNPAAWLAGCRTCPRRSIWCEVHYEMKMDQIEDGLNRRHHCYECGANSREFYDVFFVVQI